MWFFQSFRSAKSQHDDQQQHQDSQLQSDLSDKQEQVLAQELKNPVSSSEGEVIDRYIQGQSVVTDEEDQVKQVVDEDHRHLVVKEAVNEASQASSSCESETKNHCQVKSALIVDTKECRVSEERETGERYENQDIEKVYEHKDGVLKEKHDVEIKDTNVRSKIGSYENNDGDGLEEGSVTVSDDGKSKTKAYHYPLRPDCSHYKRTGMCKFGSNCRFNHPHIGEIQPINDTKKKIEENTEKHGPIEGKVFGVTPVVFGVTPGLQFIRFNGSIGLTKPVRENFVTKRFLAKDTKKKKEEKVERHVPIESKPAKETKKKMEENENMHGPIEFKPIKKTNKKMEVSVETHGPVECKPTKETKMQREENTEKHEPLECKATQETKKKKEENMERHGQTECKPAVEIKKKKEENMEMHRPIECKPTKETENKKEGNLEKHGPIESKIPIYSVTSINKFKHSYPMMPTKVTKMKKEENAKRHWPVECKNHMSSVDCKNGKACKFNHGKGKNVKKPVVEYNFVGLPIRPGEKECPYYMRNGFCQHGPTCRLHHPDPTTVECDDAPTSYGNDGPQPNIPNMPSWSAPRTLDPTSASFVPMMYSPPQNMPPSNPDLYVSQAPAHLYSSSEWGPPIPPPFFPHISSSDTNMYTHQQQSMLVSKSPERAGPPNCRYFIKTGDCKNGASCKFRHSQSRITPTSKDQPARIRRRNRRVNRPESLTQQSA